MLLSVVGCAANMMRTKEADGSKALPRARSNRGRYELVSPSSLLGTSDATDPTAATG